MRATRRRFLPLAAALLLGACAESAAPSDAGILPPVDANLATVDHALATEAWQSLQALGPRFAPAGAAALAAAGRGDAVARVARLPGAILGTTFVLDSTSLAYVPDSSRTGAPVTGVRFILYALNPVTGQPVPGAEIGYADLIDEGIGLPIGIALRLRVVAGGTTWLEYAVTAVSADSGGGFQAAGFTHADGTRVEFRAGLVGGQVGDTTAQQLEFVIGIPARRFDAHATLRHADLIAATAAEVALEVAQDEGRLGLAARTAGGQVAAEFRLNQALFATAHGDVRDPVVLDRDGMPLSAAEWETLRRMLGLVDGVFRMFDGLMRPVAGMLGAGA